MQEKSLSKFDFEQCQKCAICVNVCPMHEANPLYPGPKQAGPDWERYRLKNPGYFDYSLKYCLNCKRCEVACPSGVKIADLIARAKLEYGSGASARLQHPVNTLRDWTLANTDLVGSMAVPFSGVLNPLFAFKPVKAAMGLIGVDSRRQFPEYAREKFTKWFDPSTQEGFSKYVTYFHGCYVNYNYPELGIKLVKLMNALGWGVKLMPEEKCCGVALIANGFSKQAAKNARTNIKAMEKALSEGSEAILTTSSSCTYTMRDEYPGLLEVDNSSVKGSLMTATRFLYELLSENPSKLVFKQGWKKKMAYHTPCHMQRMGWQIYSIGLLKMIPGLELTILDQECCGIAGTFGFKKENYAYSQKIGSKLFKAIEDSGADAVACDCETCKWQIEMSTSKKVLNPIEILFDALDYSAGVYLKP